MKSRLDTLKLGDLTKGFKNYSKDSGLDIMDSKKPLAVFTEGKKHYESSVIGISFWHLSGGNAVARNWSCVESGSLLS